MSLVLSRLEEGKNTSLLFQNVLDRPAWSQELITQPPLNFPEASSTDTGTVQECVNWEYTRRLSRFQGISVESTIEGSE